MKHKPMGLKGMKLAKCLIKRLGSDPNGRDTSVTAEATEG
jgi:hypothetical protein